MKCDLVRTETSDGVRLDGAWFEPTPANSRPTAIDVAVGFHGVAGNFYSSNLFENLTPAILDWGIPLLMVNTRGHDAVHYSYARRTRRMIGAAFEIVNDCRYDVAAWVEWLTRQGYKRILLAGHSLGAIKVVYAAATDCRPEIASLLVMSAPCLSGSNFRNGAESDRYLESLSAAQNLIRDGRPNSLMESTFPFPMLITAAGYIDKYGPGDRYDFLQHLPQVNCPVLLTYGELELQSGSTAFLGLAESVQRRMVTMPNLSLAVIPRADHNYSGESVALTHEINRWSRSILGVPDGNC